MTKKCLDKRVQSKQTLKHKLGDEQTDGRTLAAQVAKCSLSSNGNNAKDNAD